MVLVDDGMEAGAAGGTLESPSGPKVIGLF